jgi:hypothetical protein
MVNGITSAALIGLALYLVFRAIVRVRADRLWSAAATPPLSNA